MTDPFTFTFMNISRTIAALGGAIILGGCSNDESRIVADAKKNPATTTTVEASEFLFALHKSGNLPGDSPDDQGQMTSDFVPFAVSNDISYPISRTFHVVRTDNTSTNHYTLMKLSIDSPWKLQRAWETDSNGQAIKEWPIQ